MLTKIHTLHITSGQASAPSAFWRPMIPIRETYSTMNYSSTTHSRPQIIGIGGALRSGKDTVADYLVEKHGYVKFGMSDPLAKALYTLNPIVSSKAKGWFRPKVVELRYAELADSVGYVEAKKLPEVRALLQRLGTEVGRDMLGQNTWVNAARNSMQKELDKGNSVVLTGVRFPNESEMIETLDGHTLLITRPETEPSTLSAEHLAHASETSLDRGMFEFHIENDSTLDALYAQVVDLLGEL